MLIKSQNRRFIVNLSKLDTIGHYNGEITAFNGESEAPLGKYSSDERCGEILNEIAEHYNKCEYAKFMGCDNTSYVSNIYEMPER